MNWPALIFVANLAAAWFMTGLIWFVQVVHYPQFCDVGVDAFKTYHARHTRLTTRVVAGPMLIELVAAVALLFVRPASVSMTVALVSLALVVIAWGSTAFLQVSRHNSLSGGFSSRTCTSLVATNWIRTLAWTIRGGLFFAVCLTLLHF